MLKRLTQSGSSSADEIKQVEIEKRELHEARDQHKQQAQDSHDAYIESLAKCKEMWSKIKAIEQQPNSESNEQLAQLKDQFELTLCADYQQSKLIPYWGYSPQPGQTYYLQKMSYDVFGIVDSRDDLAPETIGPKNTDHTLSYLTHFLTESGVVPTWVKRIHLFLDNACSTNKNCYMVGYVQEMVQQNYFSFLRVSFMIAGHTKFSVDQLFSRISVSYNRSVFKIY